LIYTVISATRRGNWCLGPSPGDACPAHGLWPCWEWVPQGVGPSRCGGPGYHYHPGKF